MSKLNLLQQMSLGPSIWAILGLLVMPAHAKKMDIETHSYVIAKLEQVLSGKNAPSRDAIELRLGDLYSEKARLIGMEEAEGRCQAKDCKQSVRDRATALKYYQDGIAGANKRQKARALIQMAHLHDSLGQEREAIRTYQKVIREGARTHGADIVGLAHNSLGDIYYRNQKFKPALTEFQKAYNNKETESRGHSLYRMAWSHFNLGQTAQATRYLEQLAQSPDLLTRKSTRGRTYDIAFHEEVSRDLATFYARTGVGAEEVQKIISFSPLRAVKSNLIFLASESDRLGKKHASLEIWMALSVRDDLTKYERIEAQVRIAQIHYDLGSQPKALAEYQAARDLWKKVGCDDPDQCEVLRIRMRNFVTDWNKKDKNRLSVELLSAYQTYIALFPSDLDMKYWAAGIAFDLKRWKDAARLYRDSSVTAHAQLEKASKKEKPGIIKIFEGALLAEIDVAERASDLKLREQAYDHYLNLNPNGEKHLEVRYQRAQVEYERKNYKDAANRFKQVANFTKAGQIELRKKAADLALDALAFTSDDLKIDAWSLEFAKVFPKSKADYYKVSRKARLNYAAKVANSKSPSKRALVSTQKLLKGANLYKAAKDEKIALFKNRLVIAEKLRDLDETIVAASALYAVPGLSEQDNNYALGRKAWAAEMLLDFKGAYYLSRKIPMKELSPADKELRLATLAELAGLSEAKNHYKAFIKLTNSKKKANQIRAKLVLQANNPDRELNIYLGDLQRTPDVLATLAYELFIRDQSFKRAERMLNNRGVKNTDDGKALARHLEIRDLGELDKEIQRHRLMASSDSLMNKTLSQRLDLLRKADHAAADALNANDWTLEILALSIVQEQNARIYKELAELPLPTGLSKEQKKQYIDALRSQATPYKKKSDEVEDKLSSLWSQRSSYESLKKDFQQSSFQEKRVVKMEVRALRQKASGGAKSFLSRMLDEETKAPDHRVIMAARQKVKNNPFNLRSMRQLRDLEREHGRQTMVGYLEERIEITQKAGG